MAEIAVPNIDVKALEIFFFYIHEREKIRQAKLANQKFPWSADPILSTYKFTNVLRYYDKTTQWVLNNWYIPNYDEDLKIQALNCMIFRFFGTTDFAKVIGYQREFNPEFLLKKSTETLAAGQKVFTGAYIITNMGLSIPKQEVVVTNFLTPYWKNLDRLIEIALSSKSWEQTLNVLMTLPGYGPFMAKEVGLDLQFTKVLKHCHDSKTWSPAGPGAIRGLNRLLGRENIEYPMSQAEALTHMRYLTQLIFKEMFKYPEMQQTMNDFGVTDTQFNLCEFDKYMRVLKGQGRPRAKYHVAKEHK